MIVFLSSSARQRYADDVIRILALPQGGQLQLRYNATWLADDVRSRVASGQLLDEQALLCFVGSATAPLPFGLEPVRWVRIIRAERVGTSYIFTIAADYFVDGLDDAAVRKGVAAADRARLPSAAKAKNELYAFTADISGRSRRSLDFAAFEDTADRLSKHDAFNQSTTGFFAVHAIRRVAGRSWFYSAGAPRRVEEGAYRLSTGRRFECEVYCLRLFEPQAGQTVPALALMAAANDAAVQFVSNQRSAIDSRYDIKRFQFATESEALHRVGGLRLFLRAGGDDETCERQGISLPLIFGGSKFLAMGRMLAIGIASAGPAMVAAQASNKLSAGTAILMIAIGAIAGLSAVFPSFKKP